jgi:predicted nucleic acid-binding protein
MIRAFLDSSVLFASCVSLKGASREIVQQGLRGMVVLVISPVVLDEVERNLAEFPRYAMEALAVFHQYVDSVPFQIVQATQRQVRQAARYTALKDAPIVAAAKRAKVDYLASLDRRHLVGVELVAQRSGLQIVLPEELLRAIREQTSRSGAEPANS